MIHAILVPVTDISGSRERGVNLMRMTRETTSGTKGLSRARLMSTTKSVVKAVGMSISAHRVRNMGSRKNTAPMKGGSHK